jgi:hypothetical protein
MLIIAIETVFEFALQVALFGLFAVLIYWLCKLAVEIGEGRGDRWR